MATKTAKNLTYLSEEGLVKAKMELEQLISVDRQMVIEHLTIAKEYGSTDDNTDLEIARIEQSFVEGRIEELEALIRNAQIIEPPKSNRRVAVGSRVELTCEDGPISYTIVGRAEADPAGGKISNESPLGKALLGKVVGDTITVNAPSGCFEYSITKIEIG
jgi:transcription elongation factor GreA